MDKKLDLIYQSDCINFPARNFIFLLNLSLKMIILIVKFETAPK